ncbi:MAG: hypothetical protein HY466_02065 [Deltaproteobacteria bacterium]|nr:hypothetical protein [Deltaproteobacteria bacterium]
MKAFFLFLLIPWLVYAQPPWEPLKAKVIQADLTAGRGEQKRLAKEALKMAEDCLAKNVGEIGCLYYRAQALGLSNKSFFRYAGRLRQMFADWEAVSKADPSFDYGGPYRMLAEVYMELPKHFGPKDLRQDLNKSIKLLKKAIKFSDYPTNWFDLAEAYAMLDQREASQKAMEKAKSVVSQWRTHPYYLTWQGKK